MKRAMLAALLVAANASAQWQNDPNYWGNSPGHWENSPSYFQNDPNYWENRPEWGTGRTVQDNAGRAWGYAVPRSDGGVNVFDYGGTRRGYVGPEW